MEGFDAAVKTVLITAIGGDIAQGVAAIVREIYSDWRIIGTDVHERHGGSLFADEIFVAPRAYESSYNGWLADLIHRENVDLCVPISEPELQALLSRSKVQYGEVIFIMPNAKAIQIGFDKLETARFLDSLGLSRPWTLAAETNEGDIPLPCVFKPRHGSGSRSVFVCRTTRELNFYREVYPDGVFQELLLPDDREITCAVYRTKNREVVVLQMLRALVGGLTGWAQVIDVPEIGDQCKRIADALDLQGPINVQLRLTDSGPRIFEINARFSSTVLMRHRMGFCDVVWSIEESMRKRVNCRVPDIGTTAARTQGAKLMSSECGFPI